MGFPAVKLHEFYSINFYDGLDIIIEDFKMIDVAAITTALKEKKYDEIVIVPGALTINTKTNTISLLGHDINDRTYIVNKNHSGHLAIINYNCPIQQIVTGLEYVYHMYNNIVS